jgi:hypothetical protein
MRQVRPEQVTPQVSSFKMERWIPIATEYLAIAFMSFALLGVFVCFTCIARGWLKGTDIYYYLMTTHVTIMLVLIFSLFQTFWKREIVPIVIITQYFVMLETLFIILTELESFKIICTLSRTVDQKRIKNMQIAAILIHFLIGFGFYLQKFLNVGVITVWNRYGFIVWITLFVAYENTQVFLVSLLLYKHIKKAPNPLKTVGYEIAPQSLVRKVFRFFVGSLVSLTLMDLIGIILQSWKLFHNKADDDAFNGRFGFSLDCVSISLLGFHAIAICAVLHFMNKFKFSETYNSKDSLTFDEIQ